MSVTGNISKLLNALSVQARRDGNVDLADTLKEASQLVRRAALPGNEEKLAAIATACDAKLAGPEPEALVPADVAESQLDAVEEEAVLEPVEEEGEEDLFDDLDEAVS